MFVITLIKILLWRHYGLNEFIYEVAPGILSGILTFFFFKVFIKKYT